MAKSALIVGITGQDGSYLAEYLLGLGYRVVGLRRAAEAPPRDGAPPEIPGVDYLAGDLLDAASLRAAVDAAHPDEVYNLGAITFVATAPERAPLVADVTGLGALRLLEAARQASTPDRPIRFFQAGSAEMFGAVETSPQDERTPLRPRNVYGAAKVFAYHAARSYREMHGLHAGTAILFNHESPRRGPEFVTRKITRAVAAIVRGEQRELRLGNLDAIRDWGFAGDYVRAMHAMLQQPAPDDLVVGTGVPHTVRDFVAAAFARAGLDWRDHVVVDERFYRPLEPAPLVADPARARRQLGWTPSVAFDDLVRMMVDADLASPPS